MSLVRSEGQFYFNPMLLFMGQNGRVFQFDRSAIDDIKKNSGRAFLGLLVLDAIVGLCWLSTRYLSGSGAFHGYLFRLLVVVLVWSAALLILLQSVVYKTRRVTYRTLSGPLRSCRQPLVMQLPLLAFLSIFLLSFPLVALGMPVLTLFSDALTLLVGVLFIGACADYLWSFLRSRPAPRDGPRPS